MKILVTGGGGFLGGAIVRKLLKRGTNVKTFSRTHHPWLKRLNIEEHCGDIADFSALCGAAKGCDIVIHVAAKAGIWGKYKEYYTANVKGTQNVINACLFHNIKSLVYTSSPSVVYKGIDQEGVNEQEPYAIKFLAHYPETKAMAEKIILSANGRDLATVALRPHLIWGPGDNHLIPRIINRAKSGQLRKIGKEQKLVDSIYVDNAAEAHILAADLLSIGSKIAGKAYFLSQGKPQPMGDLINSFLIAANIKPVDKYISNRTAYMAGWLLETIHTLFLRAGEPRMTRFLARQLSTHHWFDISAAKNDLGYAPSVSTEEGLFRLKEYLNKSSAEDIVL